MLGANATDWYGVTHNVPLSEVLVQEMSDDLQWTRRLKKVAGIQCVSTFTRRYCRPKPCSSLALLAVWGGF